MGVFNLADQFLNYYEYHTNPVNQIIHFVFVPVLTFSFTMLLTSMGIKWPILSSIFSPENPYVMNIGFLFITLLIIYYLLLDRFTGSILAVELISFLILSVHLYGTLNRTTYFFVIALTQLVGWGTQFAGHGIWEGRRPALVDNGLQVFIAPLFVMVEAMFFLGLKQDLKKEVEQKLKARRSK